MSDSVLPQTSSEPSNDSEAPLFVIGPFPVGTASYSEGDLVADFVNVNAGQPRLMVDVGAHHGYALERFADAGWTIHAFEPDPANRSRSAGSERSVLGT